MDSGKCSLTCETAQLCYLKKHSRLRRETFFGDISSSVLQIFKSDIFRHSLGGTTELGGTIFYKLISFINDFFFMLTS